MYKFADLAKGGCLVKTFQDTFQSYGRDAADKAVQDLAVREISMLLYNGGKGKTVTRAEFIHWKHKCALKKTVSSLSDIKYTSLCETVWMFMGHFLAGLF